MPDPDPIAKDRVALVTLMVGFMPFLLLMRASFLRDDDDWWLYSFAPSVVVYLSVVGLWVLFMLKVARNGVVGELSATTRALCVVCMVLAPLIFTSAVFNAQVHLLLLAMR